MRLKLLLLHIGLLSFFPAVLAMHNQQDQQEEERPELSLEEKEKTDSQARVSGLIERLENYKTLVYTQLYRLAPTTDDFLMLSGDFEILRSIARESNKYTLSEIHFDTLTEYRSKLYAATDQLPREQEAVKLREHNKKIISLLDALLLDGAETDTDETHVE